MCVCVGEWVGVSVCSVMSLCNPMDYIYIAHQVLLSMGFSRQEYWSGLPFPPPGHRPDLRIEAMSLVSPALAGRFFTTGSPGKPITSELDPLLKSSHLTRLGP